MVILKYLADIGIRGKFDAENPIPNFWELYPWNYSESDWRRKIGRDFDTLKREDCFEEVTLDTVSHSDNTTIALEVVKVDKNTTFGVSDHPSTGLRTLTSTDITGYKLNLLKLCNLIGTSLRLQGQPRNLDQGIYNLGLLQLAESTKIKIYLATSMPNENIEKLITHDASNGVTVLIVPNDCVYQSSRVVINVDLVGLNFGGLLSDIVIALDLEDQVPPHIWLSHDLIIDSKRNKIWFKGVEVKEIDRESHPFKFALKVAEADGNIVSKQTLNNFLSPYRTDDKVASTAKTDFLKLVKKSFSQNGIVDDGDIKAIFRSPTGGYAINCSHKEL